MNNQYHDSFVNPVGSVPSIDVELPSYEAPSTVTDVYGKYGKLRHSGNFSFDNPVLPQLEAATSNQDKDALYEAAVKWEIDHDTDLRQQALNRSILEEQREYDSPLSQIARERAAGINSDIASGSSPGTSSGSAQMSPVELGRSATQNTTKFSNAYDNTSLVLQGLGTAASVASAVTSVGGFALSAIKQAALLPAEASLMSTNASIAQQTEKYAVQQSKFGSILTSLGLLQNLGSIITDSISDDDATNIMKTVGISDSDIPGMLSNVRAYNSNPAIRAFHSKSLRDALTADEELRQYTPSVIADLVQNGLEITRLSQQYDKDWAYIESSISSYLRSSDYASNTGESMLEQSFSDLTKQKLARKQIEHDLEAFISNLRSLDRAVVNSETTVQKIYADARAAGRGQLSSAEQAIVDSEMTTILNLRALGSQQLHKVFSFMDKSSQSRYMADVNLNEDGNVELTPGIPKHQIFTGYNYMFSSVVGDDDNFSNLLSAAISAIPVVGAFGSYAVNQFTPKPKIGFRP